MGGEKSAQDPSTPKETKGNKKLSRTFFPYRIKAAKLAAEIEGKALTVMFQDEARFGRITTRSDCWAPEGMRPVVPQQAIREYTYAYAAVAPETGEVDSLILPDMRGSTLSVFLKELSMRHPNELILMILDGAPCHHSKKEELVIPKNIWLQFLPPYSPELNPVENLWDEMREKHFSNSVFRDMNAVRKRMVEGLLALECDKTRVGSIVGFPWILEALES